MINKIKNLLITLKEDYHSDKEKRELAETIYYSIINNFDTIKFDTYNQNVSGLSFHPDQLGFDEYKELQIVLALTPENERYNRGGYYLYNSEVNPPKHILVLYSSEPLPNKEIKYIPSNKYKNYINKTLINKYHFIHEFIHYLDRINYTNPEYDFLDANYHKDMSGYLNNPPEYNAHYQEILSRITDYITKDGSILKLPFNEFLEKLKEDIPKLYNVLKDLKKPFYNKFIRRLYHFYKESKSKT